MKTKALIFDMDGTLTPNTQPVSASVLKRLKKLQGTYKLYLVTVSNYEKVENQFKWHNVTNLFERVFCCNGTIVYQTALDPDDEFGNLEPDMIHKVVLTDHYSQSDLNYLISILLKYAYKNHTKFKTGTFVEWRDSQINFSLIGRNCSQAQRDDYVKWDRKSGDRDKAIKFLEEKFKSYGLSFRKGGQISIDISRQQWSKAYAFENIQEAPEDCVFFGDNIVPVGNDWEIAKMCRKFHAVEGPEHLLKVLKEY